MELDDRAKRIFFTKEDDFEMMGLVNHEDPFMYPHRWAEIGETLKQRRHKHFTGKNVKQRAYLLLTAYRCRDKKQQCTSGKEGEFKEMDQLLQAASDLKAVVDINPSLKKRKYRKEVVLNTKECRDEEALGQCVGSSSQFSDDFINIGEVKCEAIIEVPSTPISTEFVASSTIPAQRDEHCTTNASTYPFTCESSSTQRTKSATLWKSMKKRKRNVNQLVHKILKEGRNFKIEMLALEKMKIENDRLRLENESEQIKFNYELEKSKLTVLNNQLGVMKQLLEIMPSSQPNSELCSHQPNIEVCSLQLNSGFG